MKQKLNERERKLIGSIQHSNKQTKEMKQKSKGRERKVNGCIATVPDGHTQPLMFINFLLKDSHLDSNNCLHI